MTPDIAINKPLQPKPLLITVVAHILLLLLLAVWSFSLPPAPPPIQEMGMEVNLGTTADGSGVDQPMDIEDPAPEASNASRSAASAASNDAEVERSDDEDAPSVPQTNSIRQQRTASNTPAQRTGSSTTTTAPTNSTQPQRPRYVYNGSTGRGGNSAAANMPGTGEGNTTAPGDRGVPGGTPGSPNYTGSPGNGTGGISHSLGGRNIVAFPPKEAQFREGGRVIVRVTVNRDGSIVNMQIVSSTNTELSPIALRKLQQVRFNKSESAPEEQFGNITFVFKTRQ
jgi:TonB family protein